MPSQASLGELKELLSPVWSHLTEAVIERGEGAWLIDTDGNRHLDFTSGIGVTNTGHCHPRVVAAIRDQAERLLFGQMNCVIPRRTLDLAGALRPIMPEGLDTFFFASSGAEAVEGAVKLAKAATGRPNIIAFQGGFHGRTHLAMALTCSKTIYRAMYQPLPGGIFYAPFPYAFRSGQTDDEGTDHCLYQLELLLKQQTSPCETAALIVEPVLGEGGYVAAPPRFMQGLRAICDREKMLLILDEIQSGFGRTGDWWAHTRMGVRADILIMAKGIASGMPLSGIAAPRALMNKWTTGSHGGTYAGGNAVVMAAAVATVEALREERLVENAAAMGARLTAGLKKLQARFPALGDVRGPGLMIATEFVDDHGKPSPGIASALQKACLKRRLMLLTCGTYGNTVRWIPPLVVKAEEIDHALGIFEQALEECCNPAMAQA